MTITLYNNTSEKNRINKVLEHIIDLNGTLKDASSITNPEIILEYSDVNFNYCYIDAFSRYYFVNDIIVMNNNLIRVILSVDVLESFKNEILSQNVIINKNTSDIDKYLPDENWKVNVKTKTDIVNFPNGFLDSGEFILITAGG